MINPLAPPRNESIPRYQTRNDFWDDISAKQDKNVFGSGWRATHVLMWERLEDELLFNSVLIGKGVIALCYFSPSLALSLSLFFSSCKPAIAYRCCCRVRMKDRLLVFSGGWEKKTKQTKRAVFVWSLPLTTSPLFAFPPWGVGKKK